MSFKASISKYLFLFVHCFGIIIKEKCSPFNQGIIQQPIMSINKVITPMTELSEPPSYCKFGNIRENLIFVKLLPHEFNILANKDLLKAYRLHEYSNANSGTCK